MKPTEIAAWWGAGIATLILFWDIYKWIISGPKFSFRVSSNMKFFGDLKRDDQTYVTIRATNKGDRPTTISS